MRERKKQRELYWDGLRDGLVVGKPNPGLPQGGLPIAENPYYRRGFEDGKRAEVRLTREANTHDRQTNREQRSHDGSTR